MIKPEKKWQKYTQYGDLWVNMTKYLANLKPTQQGCLEWQGPKHRQGYGMMGAIQADNEQRIMTVAHRVAWRIEHKQPLGRHDHVKHTCGNNLCCRADHLTMVPQIKLEMKKNGTNSQMAVQR
jgi:hypothetical protein